MGESSENCSPLDFFDSDDFPKYLSGLSTLLVATIQELKDRISQIEFIFCSQLFPNFQTELSKYRRFKERLCQAKKDTEADWKRKENSLLLLIEDLRREKREALDRIPQIQASYEQEKADLVEHFRVEKEKLLQVHEAEKSHLLSQVKGLQVDLEATGFRELQLKAEEVDGGKEVQKKLQQQIKENEEELKCRELNLNIIQSKLSTEQQRAELAVGKFKQLKMMYLNLRYQYELLISRSGFVAESELPRQEMEDEFGLLSNPTNSAYSKDGDSSMSASPRDQDKVKDISVVTKELETVKNSDKMGNPVAPGLSNKTSFSLPQKRPVSVQTEIPAGLKRSMSWRNTRSRQAPGGADPHDDFLDTPLENIRENLKKVSVCNPDPKIPKEEVQDILVAPPKHMDPDPEVETHETDPCPACPGPKITAARADGGSFKYVAPVRRKGDREFLKGVEFKQCKKFYDAVKDDGGIDSSNKIQCEHHHGVSRHRYRYLPPPTPDGFWNIGFDSDA